MSSEQSSSPFTVTCPPCRKPQSTDPTSTSTASTSTSLPLPLKALNFQARTRQATMDSSSLFYGDGAGVTRRAHRSGRSRGGQRGRDLVLLYTIILDVVAVIQLAGC